MSDENDIMLSQSYRLKPAEACKHGAKRTSSGKRQFSIDMSTDRVSDDHAAARIEYGRKKRNARR
jgi:hypothetical protein